MPIFRRLIVAMMLIPDGAKACRVFNARTQARKRK